MGSCDEYKPSLRHDDYCLLSCSDVYASYANRELVLGLRVDLLLLALLYEGLYSSSVPPRLPIRWISESLLCPDGDHRCIFYSNLLDLGFGMRAGSRLLGSDHSSDLRQSEGCLVCAQLGPTICCGRLTFSDRFTNACINIVTDICTAVLPIRALSSLHLPRRQKYALIAVFALGGL